jgi:hypothetical protein
MINTTHYFHLDLHPIERMMKFREDEIRNCLPDAKEQKGGQKSGIALFLDSSPSSFGQN